MDRAGHGGDGGRDGAVVLSVLRRTLGPLALSRVRVLLRPCRLGGGGLASPEFTAIVFRQPFCTV